MEYVCIHKNTYMHAVTIGEKEAVTLKKDGGRDILGVEGRKVKREMLYYNFKFFKKYIEKFSV